MMRAEKVGTEIQRIVKCQVLWDKYSRDFYSVDSSSFLVKPLVVVFPRNENEIVKILKFASKKNIPITPRGAGTRSEEHTSELQSRRDLVCRLLLEKKKKKKRKLIRYHKDNKC